jgi:hypothetical protein
MPHNSPECRAIIESQLTSLGSDFSKLVFAAVLSNSEARGHKFPPAARGQFSEETLEKAARAPHLQWFRVWLSKSIPEQRDDLENFRADLRSGAAIGWLMALARLHFVPGDATQEEAALFQSDLDAALAMLEVRPTETRSA